MAFTTIHSRRRLVVAVICAVLLLVLIVTAVRFLRATPGEDSEGSPSSAPSTVAPPENATPERTAPATPLTDGEAADTTLEALTRTATALSDPGNPVDLSDVLTGSALDEYLAQSEEFMNTGVHQEGAPTIENARITNTSEDGTSLEVEACVDSSAVQVLNDQGTDLRASQPKRSLTIFTLTNPDGSWKLASETFPDDPTC